MVVEAPGSFPFAPSRYATISPGPEVLGKLAAVRTVFPTTAIDALVPDGSAACQSALPLDALNAAHQTRHHSGPGAAPRLVAETIPLAQALGASLEIVYVRETRSQAEAALRDVDKVDDWIDRRLGEMAESAAIAKVACMTTSLQGSMRRALVAHVKKTKPDLVVLGSYPRWHLVETCAQHILRDARRRILVVPIDDPEERRETATSVGA